jgi:hypothetical protein
MLHLLDDKDMELSKDIAIGQVKFRLRITYNSFGREHKTIQTEQLMKIIIEDNTLTKPIAPQLWK